jgi:hypothetical protein
MKNLLCALILPVTMASDIARIGYVTRRQYIQSSLPQHYQYTLVQPWELWVAPFQVADGTIGTSTSRPSIRESPEADVVVLGSRNVHWAHSHSPTPHPTTGRQTMSSHCSSWVSSSLPWSSTGKVSSLASPMCACDRKFRRRPSSDHRVTGCRFLIWDFLFCSAIHVAGDHRRYCRAPFAVFANYRVGIG